MEENKGTIFMLEDETSVLAANTRMLKRRGYEILSASSVSEAREVLAGCNPDLLILDLMLPDGSGYDICSEFRQSSHKPVLFLTGKTETMGKIEGLKRGGDYYLTKPYDFDELLAVIERLLEKDQQISSQLQSQNVMTFGSLSIDTLNLKVTLDGEEVFITHKEYLLLLALAQKPGEAISLDDLYEAAWGMPSTGDNRVVRTHISNLRSKIDADNTDDYDIISIYGKGYTFVCD